MSLPSSVASWLPRCLVSLPDGTTQVEVVDATSPL